jgi:hypothetical protein
MEALFNDQLIEDYSANFFGYGRAEAPVWFIGMGEGGGDSIDEINRRFTVWSNRGRRPLENLREYHEDIGVTPWFRDPAKRQATWAGLILMQFGIQGHRLPSGNDVLRYQKDGFVCSDGKECLMELLPLPSRSSSEKDWLYGDSLLPQLKRRSIYRKHYSDKRAERISGMIESYRPKVVVFYSSSAACRTYWNRIAQESFHETDVEGVLMARGAKTLFALCPHPANQWKRRTDSYFFQVGELIAAHC